MNRIIGEYSGSKNGPLLIIFGAMHGNEPAGVKALKQLFLLLDNEPQINPGFSFKGKVIGLIGNVQAYVKNVRFMDKDLNRQWKKEHVQKLMKAEHSDLFYEDLEMREIMDLIQSEIHKSEASELIILDLHTTSSHGGIFIIPSEDEESFYYAKQMHAPVVTEFLKGVFGTTLHYFNTENLNIPTTAITFEAGQHQEVLSKNRAVAAIINLMRSIKMVDKHDVENHHDELLIAHSENLPKVCRLIQRHPIHPEDDFEMLPNFSNFQEVFKNQQLAKDKNGPIYAHKNSRILMPLYQAQGEDGFFLVEEISES